MVRRKWPFIWVGVILLFGHHAVGDSILTAEPGFVDSFESGYLEAMWQTQSSRPNDPRSSFRLTDQFPTPDGTKSLVLGYSGVDYVRIELTLSVDLGGYSKALLSFYAKDYGDEPHDLPVWGPFSGSTDADYVAASPDGVTWYPLLALTSASGSLDSSWKEITIPLEQALSVWAVPVSSVRYIRFCQYDNGRPDFPSEVDGIGLDQIRLSAPASFGDAPHPFPVTHAEGGAIHEQSMGPFLGSPPYWRETGVHDDLAEINTSDDGIRLLTPMMPGTSCSIEITASAAGWVQGWVDFNGNGDWTDPDEVIFTDLWHPGGTIQQSFSVPAGILPGHHAVARFRISSLAGLGSGGTSPDGEVEDYLFPIYPPAPDITVPPAPLLTSPAVISWQDTGATVYFSECANAPDFQIPLLGSVQTSGLTASFPVSEDGTLWFRARGSIPARRREETFSLLPPFSGAALTDTQNVADLGITLGGANVRYQTVGGPSETNRVTFSNGGRANVYRIGSNTRILSWEVFLGCKSSVVAELAIYKGGATVSDPWAKIWSRQVSLEPGIGWVNSGPVNWPFSVDELYAFAVTSPDTVDIFSSANVKNNPDWGTLTHRAVLTGFPGSFDSAPPPTTDRPYYMKFRAADPVPFIGSGTAVIPVTLPANMSGWKAISFFTESFPSAEIAFDALAASTLQPVPGFENLPNPADLTGLPPENFVLRARLTSADPTAAPVLRAVHVTCNRDPETLLQGEWSVSRSVYADINPPRLTALTRLDPSPTRENTVRYQAVFSEPVSGPGLSFPYPGWIPTGIASAQVSSIVPSSEPNAWIVTLSLPEGVGGMLGLRRESGTDLMDQVGRGLAEAAESVDLYDIDRIRPWVTGFWRMDPSPTNAPVVRWRVFFSEPVINIPLHQGNDGWMVTGTSQGVLLGVEAHDDYCDVLVQSGPQDGSLGIMLSASSSLTDRVGWPLAINAVANTGYQISHLRLIQVPPPEITVSAGSRLELEVAATGGSAPRQYVWSWSSDGASWRNISGGDQPRLVLDYVVPSDDGWYICQVTDAWESVSIYPIRVHIEGQLPIGGWYLTVLLAFCLTVLAHNRCRSSCDHDGGNDNSALRSKAS